MVDRFPAVQAYTDVTEAAMKLGHRTYTGTVGGDRAADGPGRALHIGVRSSVVAGAPNLHGYGCSNRAPVIVRSFRTCAGQPCRGAGANWRPHPSAELPWKYHA